MQNTWLFVEKLKNTTVEHLPSAEVQLEKRLAEEREKLAENGGVMPPQLTPLLTDLKAKKLQKLQARANSKNQPKRGSDRPERRKRQKDSRENKIKDLSKPQDDKPKRNRDRGRRRDSRKKRKDEDGLPLDQTGDVTAQPKKDKRGTQGTWMAIRKHLEPGSITIQPREGETNTTSATPAATPPATHADPAQQNVRLPTAPQPNEIVHQNNNYDYNKKYDNRNKPNRGRGQRDGKSKVIYAPKQHGDYTPQSYSTAQN